MIAIALAKVSYFEFPAPNSIYYQRTPIQFVANGVSHDDDVTIRVTLHACSDSRYIVQLLCRKHWFDEKKKKIEL